MNALTRSLLIRVVVVFRYRYGNIESVLYASTHEALIQISYDKLFYNCLHFNEYLVGRRR